MKMRNVIYIIFLLSVAASVFVRGQGGSPHEISAVRYNSVYDNRDAATQWAEIEQYFGKPSLLDNDTFPTRRPTGEEFKRGITSVAIPQAVGPKKDVLLVSYTVYTAFGGSRYSGSIIIATDALQKIVAQDEYPAQLMNEVIDAIAARGELRAVQLYRPAHSYVEILGWTPVRSAKFIYSTRLPEWQAAQLGKE